MLTFTGLLVAFLPMLYLISTTWLFLVLVNFFGGVVWAGLSLGLSNYVFDAVRPADRAKAVAVSSTVNAIGWAMGTLIGSWLIATVPGDLQLGSLRIDPISNLPFIFFISGSLRLVISLTLLRTFHEPRRVEDQLAAGIIHLRTGDADPGEQVHGVLHDAPLGQGKGQIVTHYKSVSWGQSRAGQAVR